MNQILVIEDDEQTRENLELILQMEGFTVQSAPNGRVGLSHARRARPGHALSPVWGNA